MNRFLTTAASAVVASATVLGSATAAAAQEPVLVSQHGGHQVWISYDEAYDVENHDTYWDFVPLGDMCGFARSTLVLSNMRETFFVQVKQNGAKAGSFTGIGKLLDETFHLTEYDAAGNAVRVYTGTGDEYAQFRGTGEAGMQADQSVNLRVVFRGASADGRKISFSIKARVRTDAQTGEMTRFDAAVENCHVK
jgi:hypothetical protein